MQVYTIVIDEDQRQSILRSLQATPPTGDGAEYLVEMLVDLPRDEAANPGVCHGFCY